MLTKKALLTNLLGAREALAAEKRDLAARIEDVEEQIARVNGEPLFAEWRRLRAEEERNPTAEASQLSHRAWVVAMADFLMKNGQSPAGMIHEAEIEAEMEGLRECSRAAG